MLDVVCPPVETRVQHRRSLAFAGHGGRDALQLRRHRGRDALESVRGQHLADVDLIVVDDGSTDGGDRVARQWMQRHADRFGRCLFARHPVNQGLAATRNQAFHLAATPYVFVLDADNELYPRCLHRCLDLAERSNADAVYTLIEVFGDERGVMGTDLWNPESLARQNYIDAMALVRQAAGVRSAATGACRRRAGRTTTSG